MTTRLRQIPRWTWLYTAAALACCAYMQWRGKMDFSAAMRVLLLLLAAIGALALPFTLRVLRGVVQRARQAVPLVLLVGWGAFAVQGNYMFVYPLDKQFVYYQFLVLFAAAVWLAPVLLLGVAGICRANIKAQDETAASRLAAIKSSRFHAACAAVFLVLPLALFLLAFNPGISAEDTRACFELAMRVGNGEPLWAWHPTFYLLVLRGILTLWNSPWAVVLAQCAFFTAVWVYAMRFIEELCGARARGVILALYAMLGCSYSNHLQIVTILKDVPYAASLVWLMVLMGKLLLLPRRYAARKRTYAALGVCLFCLCFFRQNGFVPALLCGAALLVLLRGAKPLLATLAAVLVVAFCVQGPLYTALNVADYTGSHKYIGLSQDILGVYYAGGEVSGETLEIFAMPEGQSLNDHRDSYSPYYALVTPVYSFNGTTGGFIKAYIDTFLHNPLVMTRAVLCRMDCLWNITPGLYSSMASVNYTGFMDAAETWRQYPAHSENAASGVLRGVGALTMQNDIARAVEWRVGLWTLLLLVSAAAVFLQRRRRLLWLLLPWAGQALSLLLSTGWADYRFYWPLRLMSIVFIGLALLHTPATDT